MPSKRPLWPIMIIFLLTFGFAATTNTDSNKHELPTDIFERIMRESVELYPVASTERLNAISTIRKLNRDGRQSMHNEELWKYKLARTCYSNNSTLIHALFTNNCLTVGKETLHGTCWRSIQEVLLDTITTRPTNKANIKQLYWTDRVANDPESTHRFLRLFRLIGKSLESLHIQAPKWHAYPPLKLLEDSRRLYWLLLSNLDPLKLRSLHLNVDLFIGQVYSRLLKPLLNLQELSLHFGKDSLYWSEYFTLPKLNNDHYSAAILRNLELKWKTPPSPTRYEYICRQIILHANLKELKLHGPFAARLLTSLGPRFGQLKNLEILHITDNRFEDPQPLPQEFFETLVKLQSLKVVRLPRPNEQDLDGWHRISEQVRFCVEFDMFYYFASPRYLFPILEIGLENITFVSFAPYRSEQSIHLVSHHQMDTNFWGIEDTFTGNDHDEPFIWQNNNDDEDANNAVNANNVLNDGAQQQENRIFRKITVLNMFRVFVKSPRKLLKTLNRFPNLQYLLISERNAQKGYANQLSPVPRHPEDFDADWLIELMERHRKLKFLKMEIRHPGFDLLDILPKFMRWLEDSRSGTTEGRLIQFELEIHGKAAQKWNNYSKQWRQEWHQLVNFLLPLTGLLKFNCIIKK